MSRTEECWYGEEEEILTQLRGTITRKLDIQWLPTSPGWLPQGLSSGRIFPVLRGPSSCSLCPLLTQRKFCREAHVLFMLLLLSDNFFSLRAAADSCVPSEGRGFLFLIVLLCSILTLSYVISGTRRCFVADSTGIELQLRFSTDILQVLKKKKRKTIEINTCSNLTRTRS